MSGQIHLLARELVRTGQEVTVYALNPPEEEDCYKYQPIPASRFIGRHRRAAPYFAPWGARHLQLNGFDVIHAHGEDQLLRTNRPLVRTFYGAERAEAQFSTSFRHRLFHLSMVPFEWLSERRATSIVVISDSTKRYLRRDAMVIPCGYDPAVFHSGGVKSESPSILFVGDVGTRKRAELLLSVFATDVRTAIPAAELWIVTTAHVAAPGVRSCGRVSTEDLADLYRRAWIYCMPSTYEGFGMPYLEAMASGTPVVATPNGGAEEVLDQGRAGRIVADQDLGRELVRLLTTPTERAPLIAAGLERAKAYQIRRVAQRYLSLYQGMLGKAAGLP